MNATTPAEALEPSALDSTALASRLADNLRVACRAHNQHAAKLVFGCEAIERARSRRAPRPLPLEEASAPTHRGF